MLYFGEVKKFKVILKTKSTVSRLVRMFLAQLGCGSGLLPQLFFYLRKIFKYVKQYSGNTFIFTSVKISVCASTCSYVKIELCSFVNSAFLILILRDNIHIYRFRKHFILAVTILCILQRLHSLFKRDKNKLVFRAKNISCETTVYM